MFKYKLKSSRAMMKRFKITSRGKCLRHKSGRSHLLHKKTAVHKQHLRDVVKVKSVDRLLLKHKMILFK